MLLAAGEGRRIGGGKALLGIGDAAGRTTFLAHGARLLARPGVAAVLAVLGHEADRVRALSQLPPEVASVDNPRYRDGMLTSIWCGLDAAEKLSAEAVLLHLVDHPLAAPDTVDQVVRALQDGAPIAVPSHAGQRGHPAGFARGVWPALRSATPERGARGVLADHPDWVVHVPGDPGCVAGIDTLDDYRRLLG